MEEERIEKYHNNVHWDPCRMTRVFWWIGIVSRIIGNHPTILMKKNTVFLKCESHYVIGEELIMRNLFRCLEKWKFDDVIGGCS